MAVLDATPLTCSAPKTFRKFTLLYIFIRISKTDIPINDTFLSMISIFNKVYDKSTIRQNSRELEIGWSLTEFHISIYNKGKSEPKNFNGFFENSVS